MSRIPEPARSSRRVEPARSASNKSRTPEVTTRRRPVEDEPAPRSRASANNKKAVAKPSRTPAKPAKSVVGNLKPIKERQTQAEMYAAIMERAAEIAGAEFTTRDVKAFFQAQQEYLVRCVMPRSVGSCTVVPGFVKVEVKHYPAKKVPATKAGNRINPFTGEEQYYEAKGAFTKPAVSKPRPRAQTKLKAAVQGE